MGEARFHELLNWAMFVVAAGALVWSRFATAPYGRYTRPWWSGPELPSRLAWFLMELPQPVAFLICFGLGGRPARAGALALLGMWVFHYTYRTLIYPFIPRASGMSLSVVAMGFLLNCGFGYLNGRWLFALGPDRGTEWLVDPRFVGGAVLFLGGWLLAVSSDLILRRLRGPGEHEYKIPRGGGFRLVTAPNYLGELTMWTGWTLATWSLAGAAILAVSAANLVPRAARNHAWYRERFADYPRERRRLLPWIW